MGPCNSYFDTRTRNNNNPSVNPYRWYVTLEQRKQLINVDIEHINGDGDFKFEFVFFNSQRFTFMIPCPSSAASPIPSLYQLE